MSDEVKVNDLILIKINEEYVIGVVTVVIPGKSRMIENGPNRNPGYCHIQWMSNVDYPEVQGMHAVKVYKANYEEAKRKGLV